MPLKAEKQIISRINDRFCINNKKKALGTIFVISILTNKRSEAMNNNLKKVIGSVAAIVILVSIPVISEAGIFSHSGKHHHSYYKPSGLRHMTTFALPSLFFAAGYHSAVMPVQRIHNRYNNAYSDNMWNTGYRDGYREGRIEAAKYANHDRLRMRDRDYNYRYPESRSYRSGYKAGYSKGFDSFFHSRTAHKARIR